IQVISWGKLVKLPTQRLLFAWLFDPEDAVRGDFVGPLRFNLTCILSLFAIEGICSPEHRLSVLLEELINPVREGRLTFNHGKMLPTNVLRGAAIPRGGPSPHCIV